MPSVEFQYQDWRILEMIIIMIMGSLAVFSDYVESEHYRFAAFLVVVALSIGYYVIKIQKDRSAGVIKK